MKKLLIFLLLISNLVYSQTKIEYLPKRDIRPTLAYSINMTKTTEQPTPYVNLKLEKPKSRVDNENIFVGIFISGLAFTVAALLEDPSQYGTYRSGSGANSVSQTYYVKPFWQQTPRQFMLCGGVSLVLIGGYGMLNSR